MLAIPSYPSKHTIFIVILLSLSLPPFLPSILPSVLSLSLSLSHTRTHAHAHHYMWWHSHVWDIVCAVFILFIYLWLRWVFIAVCGLSLVVVSGGCTSLQCAYFSLQWLLLLRSMGSRRAGFSSCGTRLSSCVLFLAPPLTLSLKKAHQH